MEERKVRELFRCLEEIYKLNPAVAQRLLEEILRILHGTDKESADSVTEE